VTDPTAGWLTAAEAAAAFPGLTPERLAAFAALGALRQKLLHLEPGRPTVPLYDRDELEVLAAADAASLLAGPRA